MSKALEDLDAAGALDGTELLYIVDTDGNSRKLTLADLAQWIITEESIVPASEPFRGALVKRTGNLDVAATTNTAIAWQAATYDTDSFWSAGAPTRLTVPAGVTKVRVGMAFYLSGGLESYFAHINKNNSGSFTGLPRFSMDTGERSVFWSAVLAVSAGDYFEFGVFFPTTNTIVANDATFAAIEVLEVTP